MVGSDKYCWVLPFYYCIKFVVLMISRYFVYHARSWHWFMLEFCYFANICLFAFLWYKPNDIHYFIPVFILANGPLLHSVAAFGNSLVFHSLDKTTSLLIHITPPTITYVIRWKLNNLARIYQYTPYLVDCINISTQTGYNDIDDDDSINSIVADVLKDNYLKNRCAGTGITGININTNTIGDVDDINTIATFEQWLRGTRWNFNNFNDDMKRIFSDKNEFYKYFFYYPLYAVMIHQFIYYILVCHIWYNNIVNNPNAMTSYRFIFRKRKGFLYEFMGILGENFRVFIFGFVKLFCCFFLRFFAFFAFFVVVKDSEIKNYFV